MIDNAKRVAEVPGSLRTVLGLGTGLGGLIGSDLIITPSSAVKNEDARCARMVRLHVKLHIKGILRKYLKFI